MTNLEEKTKDYSAQQYYKEAINFSQWVDLNFKNTNNLKFLTKDNPEAEGSAFNQERRKVIQESIESNLKAAIGAYSSKSSYNYKMPKITAEEWDTILNNVSIISFFQGLPIKNKYYNGYRIVANDKTNEYVTPSSIYIRNTHFNVYTNKNCSNINNSTSSDSGKYITTAYRGMDFQERTIEYGTTKVGTFLPHEEKASYDCIVTQYDVKSDEELKNAQNRNIVLQLYYTALGREKFGSFKNDELYEARY